MTSPLVSTATCHRILRRLLEDESILLLQLSYVIANIHDPIIESCDPSYPKLFPPTLLPVVVAEKVLPSSVLPPERAVQAAPEAPSTLSPSSSTVKRKNGKPANCTDPSPAPSAGRLMTFGQYWELFANLNTLYGAQTRLVNSVQDTVDRLTALLDRLEREAEELEVKHTLSVMGNRDEKNPGNHASGPQQPPLNALPPLPAASSATPQSRKGDHNESSLDDLSEIVCGFFTGATMLAYMAEHMMYTINYTNRAAPRLLELAKLWRWSLGPLASTNSAVPGTTPTGSSVSAAPGQLQPDDCATLQQYARFLDFIYRSFGPSGIPSDSRVSLAALPEHIAGTPPHVKSPGQKGGKRNTCGVRNPSCADLPPIPPDWRGFNTFVMLLATPLPSLRRYTHVARCLAGSKALPDHARQALQSDYVEVAAARLGEENTTVMSDLAQHDVASLMNLIDGGRPSCGDETLTRFRQPDDGTRVLVHYGRLAKRSGRGRHERLVFLFSDWLCYVEERGSSRLRLRAAMPLDTLRVLDVADAPAMDLTNCFELIGAQTKRYIFLASTPEQKIQWISAIRCTIKQHSSPHRIAGPVATTIPYPSSLRRGSTDSSAPLPTPAAAAHSIAKPLLASSRLNRQRTFDMEWQASRDASQRQLPAGSSSLHLVSTRLSTTGGGGPAEALHSRTSSLGVNRSTTHRPLDYDVASWSRIVNVHRRICSHDVIAESPQSSNTPPETHKRYPSSIFDLALGATTPAAVTTHPEGTVTPLRTFSTPTSIGHSSSLPLIRQRASTSNARDMSTTSFHRPVTELFDSASLRITSAVTPPRRTLLASRTYSESSMNSRLLIPRNDSREASPPAALEKEYVSLASDEYDAGSVDSRSASIDDALELLPELEEECNNLSEGLVGLYNNVGWHEDSTATTAAGTAHSPSLASDLTAPVPERHIDPTESVDISPE